METLLLACLSPSTSGGIDAIELVNRLHHLKLTSSVTTQAVAQDHDEARVLRSITQAASDTVCVQVCLHVLPQAAIGVIISTTSATSMCMDCMYLIVCSPLRKHSVSLALLPKWKQQESGSLAFFASIAEAEKVRSLFFLNNTTNVNSSVGTTSIVHTNVATMPECTAGSRDYPSN